MRKYKSKTQKRPEERHFLFVCMCEHLYAWVCYESFYSLYTYMHMQLRGLMLFN